MVFRLGELFCGPGGLAWGAMTMMKILARLMLGISVLEAPILFTTPMSASLTSQRLHQLTLSLLASRVTISALSESRKESMVPMGHCTLTGLKF